MNDQPGIGRLPNELLKRAFGFVEGHGRVCAVVARSWRLLALFVDPAASAHPATAGAAARFPVVDVLHGILEPPAAASALPWVAALLPAGVVAVPPLGGMLGRDFPQVSSAAGAGAGFVLLGGVSNGMDLLPEDLVAQAFDFLDETWKMKAAQVARRWHAASMALVLSSVLSPILWAVPPHAVRHICGSLPPHDIGSVACVCQDWLKLSRHVKELRAA